MIGWIISLFLLGQSVTTQGGTGTIEGRILASNGNPVTRIRVSAIEVSEDSRGNPDTSTQFRIVQTDNDGRYRIDNLPPGRYYIAAGLIALPTYYPGVTTVSGAKPLSVRAGAAIRNIDFAFVSEAGGIVSGSVVMSMGRVVVDDGRPLPFAAATGPNPQDARTPIQLFPGGVVRANGGFGGNTVVRGGSYQIKILGIPFGYYVKSIMTGSVDLMNQPLELVGPLSLEILVTLTTSRPPSEDAGVRVRGRIIGTHQTFAGGLPITVTLSSPRVTGSHAGESLVQADGTFEFMDVPSAIYEVSVTSNGKSLANSTLTVGESDIKDFEIIVYPEK